MATYLYAITKIRQASVHLETSLSINFDEHFLLFEVLPQLQQATEITDLIAFYKTKNEKF